MGKIATIIVLVISISISDWVLADYNQDNNENVIANAGIGLDLEESHIQDLKTDEDLPAAFRKVLNSIEAEAKTCQPLEKYRRADGVCSNLENPLQGASLHYQERLLPNAYQNGKGTPRVLGKDGTALPSARLVSTQCFPPNANAINSYLDESTSQMSMQWGQYIDHDLVSTAVLAGSGCCDHSECINPNQYLQNQTCLSGPCFSIEVPSDDRLFKNCMVFKRSFSITVNDTHEQVSGVTAFVDASTVYGSSQGQQNKLRTGKGGRLKVTDKKTLPYQKGFKCRKEIIEATSCPHAGDSRVNEFPGLTTIHLMFVREHNRLADKLAALNPTWDDEKIFQETRRIISALHQKITYVDFLPHIIGDDAMKFFQLKPGHYKYEPNDNPGMLNEFAVAAFRYGHSQIDGILTTGKDNDQPISEVFFQPWIAEDSEDSLKCIVVGQCTKRAPKVDTHITKELTDKLFMNVDKPGHSSDLMSRNVQRGRDHGVQPYKQYYNKAMEDFIQEANIEYTGRQAENECFDSIYGSYEDVDLFVGGLSEMPLSGALLGPTFAYIVGEQFRRTKFGDRYFYETKDENLKFSQAQLNEINKLSLSHIICLNSEASEIQADIFHVVSEENKLAPCENYADIDLTSWKEPSPA